MGTNAKTAHAAYVITPATIEAAPADYVDDVPKAPEPEVPEPGQLPVTPIPETPDVGTAFGVPILVGGADLRASSGTLVSYHSDDGPRTVLHTQLTEAAEEKLLDALHLTSDLVPVQVEQTVHGRLPLDQTHQLADTLITAAKSLNHHLGNGTAAPGSLPETTTAKITAAHDALDAVKAALSDHPDTTEAAMLAHYQQHVDALDQAAAAGTKVGQIAPFLHEGTTTVTVMQPALPAEAGTDHVAAVLRDATRIKPTLDTTTGHATWNGTARWDDVAGKEYAIDLGEGYHAVYRPYSINDPAKTEYSLRGRLEIIAPPGEGHGPEVVRRLGQLNLANRPMTRDEGEYAYLSANIAAQKLDHHSDVTAAMTTGTHIEDMVRQELFLARAHQAVGMSEPQLARFAKDIQLEAHTHALPAKVKVLRDAVATATGHTGGDALATNPGYDPAPRRSGGWLTWTRFDVGNNQAALHTAVQGRSFVHTTTTHGLKAMLANGTLASTERRTLMGVQPGVGKSEATDKFTGGASSVFVRIKNATSNGTGPRLVWDRPETLLARADYYGANSDTFGAINPTKMGAYGAKPTTDPFTIATFKNPANEIMFGDGIDLLGPEGPSRIYCGGAKMRNEFHSLLAAKGITHIAGKPIAEVLKP